MWPGRGEGKRARIFAENEINRRGSRAEHTHQTRVTHSPDSRAMCRQTSKHLILNASKLENELYPSGWYKYEILKEVTVSFNFDLTVDLTLKWNSTIHVQILNKEASTGLFSNFKKYEVTNARVV